MNGSDMAAVLRNPKCGSSSRIQASVSGKSGTKKANQHSTSTVWPPGISVRAISHATMTDSVSDGIRRTTENGKLIHSEFSVFGSENARIQLSTPYTAGCPGGAMLKLPTSRNSTGKAITMEKNSSATSSAKRKPRRPRFEDGMTAAEVLMAAASSRRPG